MVRNAEQAPIFVSIKEAIRLTSLSRRKLFYLIKSGELLSHKIGSRRVFRPADLASLIAE